MNDLRAIDDEATFRANHCSAFTPNNWDITPEKIFDEEMDLIKSALTTPYNDLLVLLPGKVYFNNLVQKLGMKKSAYVELIVSALKEDEDANLRALGSEIKKALKDKLPIV